MSIRYNIEVGIQFLVFSFLMGPCVAFSIFNHIIATDKPLSIFQSSAAALFRLILLLIDSAFIQMTASAILKMKPIDPLYEIKEFKFGTMLFTKNDNLDANVRRKTIFYLHGGAFCMLYPLYAVEFLVGLMQGLDKDDLQLAAIKYPLTVTEKYPKQLDIVLEAYLFLVQIQGCNDMILLGDSAGANLALALMYKLDDMGFAIKPKLSILISPWLDISFQKKYPYFQGMFDTLNRRFLARSAKNYVDDENSITIYASPGLADEKMLKSAFKNTSLIMTTGTLELFHKDHLAFFEKAKACLKRVYIDSQERESHNYQMMRGKGSVEGIKRLVDLIRVAEADDLFYNNDDTDVDD